MGKRGKLLSGAQHQQLLCCSLFSRDIELSLAASDVGPILVGTSSCGHSWHHPLRACSPSAAPAILGSRCQQGNVEIVTLGACCTWWEGQLSPVGWEGCTSEHQDPLTGLCSSPPASAPHHELTLTCPHRLPCWRSCSCPQSVRR